jgi:rod shape determining protein RodA
MNQNGSTVSTSNWRQFDFWLLGAVALLVIFGVTMIRSAVAGNIELTTETNLVDRQLLFVGAGFVAVIAAAAIDYHLWASMTRLIYLGALGLLFFLNVVGNAVFGANRWFTLFMFNVQPSEIAKIVMILVLADFFTRNKHRMGELGTVIRSFFMVMGITILILMQPNLSTSIVMIVLWFGMLWAAGLRMKHLMLFAGTGVLIIAILLPIVIQIQTTREPFLFIQPYQVDRITNFLSDDEEETYGEKYNIRQAMISIGSGGVLGQGYGQGSQVQLRFLKVRWSDFIYASMAHEFGFVGAVMVMLVLLFVVYRCLRAARMAKDTYGALIAFGVAVLIVFQAMVNVGVNLRMMPATGLTFPFVSYGGSSLLSTLLAIGLVESVILRHKPHDY